MENLVRRLTDFAESKPDDLTEMMPPSVSGVVYNQTREAGNYLDTLSKLFPADKFKLKGNKAKDILFNHQNS